MILSVKTRETTELVDITSKINRLVQESGVDQGLCMLYVPHTTAAVTINESADPSVKSDMLMILNQIIPWEANYRHLEGNSAAHIKATLVGSSELIAIEICENASLALLNKVFATRPLECRSIINEP